MIIFQTQLAVLYLKVCHIKGGTRDVRNVTAEFVCSMKKKPSNNDRKATLHERGYYKTTRK